MQAKFCVINSKHVLRFSSNSVNVVEFNVVFREGHRIVASDIDTGNRGKNRSKF